jgi:hypothetical protein
LFTLLFFLAFKDETALPYQEELRGSKLKNLDRETCVYTVAKVGGLEGQILVTLNIKVKDF